MYCEVTPFFRSPPVWVSNGVRLEDGRAPVAQDRAKDSSVKATAASSEVRSTEIRTYGCVEVSATPG